mgnify:CR=1 FL=1
MDEGYNFRCEVGVGGLGSIALLDGGTATSAVTEELMVLILNRLVEKGLDATRHERVDG